MTPAKLAEAVQVDPKTDRTLDRRRAACPTGGTATRSPRSSAWTSRTSGPVLWTRSRSRPRPKARSSPSTRTAGQFRGRPGSISSRKAEQDIGALVYSGMFMAEDVGVHRLFADRARNGARVRILLGDPDSPHVAERGASEGIDEGMAAKVRNSIVLFRPLQAIENVEIRLHGTTLVQLDLPRRRSASRQHAYLRDDGQQRTRFPPSQGGWWRHGQHVSGELRARLGWRDTIRGGVSHGPKD